MLVQVSDTESTEMSYNTRSDKRSGTEFVIVEETIKELRLVIERLKEIKGSGQRH